MRPQKKKRVQEKEKASGRWDESEKETMHRKKREERKGRQREREQKIKAAGLRVAEDPRGGKSPARGRRKRERKDATFFIFFFSPSFPAP